MNIIKLSLSVMGSLFLLTACGEESENSNSYTEAKTIKQAEYNLYVLGLMHGWMGISALDIVGVKSLMYESLSSGRLRQAFGHSPAPYFPPSLEERTIQCRDGGTMNIAQVETEDIDTFTYGDMVNLVGLRMVYHKCKSGAEYQDGTVIYKWTPDETREEFINYTRKTIVGEKYMNLVITSKPIKTKGLNLRSQTVNGVFTNKWITSDAESGYSRTYTYSNYTHQTNTKGDRLESFNGEVKLDFDCLKGTYKVKTLEKLIYNYEHHIEIGTIMLNGVNYIYEDPYMSIEVNGKSKSYLYNEVPASTPKCK